MARSAPHQRGLFRAPAPPSASASAAWHAAGVAIHHHPDHPLVSA
jgi:hypothetical protein